MEDRHRQTACSGKLIRVCHEHQTKCRCAAHLQDPHLLAAWLPLTTRERLVGVAPYLRGRIAWLVTEESSSSLRVTSMKERDFVPLPTPTAASSDWLAVRARLGVAVHALMAV